MPRKIPAARSVEIVALPVYALNDLQAFRNELFNIAETIDPTTAPLLSIRKHEQARRRALAKVFRLLGEQVDRSLGVVQSQ